MEPDLYLLSQSQCELGESHTGNMQTKDPELSQWDLDDSTCNFSCASFLPHKTMPTN